MSGGVTGVVRSSLRNVVEGNGKVMEGRSHWRVHGEHRRMSIRCCSVQVVTVFLLLPVSM